LDIAAVSNAAMTHAMSGPSYGAPPQQKMSNLFDAIDKAGTGSINQAQFSQAFQAMKPPAVFQAQGADAIFKALDPAGSGSVSKADFVATMTGLMTSLRADPAGASAAGAGQSASASTQSLNGLGANLDLTL
jgi:Ca2+-binding EF-hand superfamily protein